MEDEIKVNKTEYIEFIEFKIQKASKELEQLRAKRNEFIHNINGTNANGSVIPGSNNNGERVRWKYVIDEILRGSNGLTSVQIVNIAMKDPKNKSSRQVTRKSIGSALIINSTEKKQRYLFTKVSGVKVYSLNKNFKEQ